jgi:hypothetical protein
MSHEPQRAFGGRSPALGLGAGMPERPRIRASSRTIWTRLVQINEPLWMESLAAHVHLLRLRLDEAEREERARAILEDERRGGDE